MPDLILLDQTPPAQQWEIQNTQEIQDAAETAREVWESAKKTAGVGQAYVDLPSVTLEEQPPPAIPKAEARTVSNYYVPHNFATPQTCVLLNSALSLNAVGISQVETCMMRQTTRQMSASMLVGLGAYHGLHDLENLQHARTGYESAYYGGAIVADTGLVAGGVLNFSKYGPRWLAPAVILGAVSARVGLAYFEPLR